MAKKASHIVCAAAAMLLVYYAFVAYLLHCSPDRLIFLHTKTVHTTEVDRYHVTDSNGNEIIVRRYGKGENGSVIFFPGQHGGIRRYERTLFNPLADRGVSVFAVSYPGQDGAKGDANFGNVQELVQQALTKIDRSCPIRDTVFIGRSLGSMAAVLAADQWHPRGLVLEGTAPSLSDGIHSYMKNKWYLRPAALLPVQKIIKKDFLLTEALGKLAGTNIAIFQGSHDTLMPLDHIKEVVKECPNVRYFAVKGADHSNAFMKALPLYIETILNMLNRQAPDRNTSSDHGDSPGSHCTFASGAL